MKRLLLPTLACVTSLSLGAEFTVNSTMDTIDSNLGDGICQDDNGNCTLRAAVMEANQTPEQDTIILGTNEYFIARGGTEEDASESGDLDILTDIVIQAAGVDATAINGRNINRLIDVHTGASLSLSGVTLTGGNANNGSAIRSQGNLVLSDCAVQNNLIADSGAIYAAKDSTASISNCTFQNNLNTPENTEVYATGIHSSEATVDLASVAFIGTDSPSKGYGIYTSSGSFLTADQLSFTNVKLNTAIYSYYYEYSANATGKISLQNFKVDNSQITNNIVRGTRVSVDNATIKNSSGRFIYAHYVNVTNSNISDLTADYPQYTGIYAHSGLTVENSVFDNLTARNCTAIEADDRTVARIVNTRFTNNTATDNYGIVCVNSGSYVGNSHFENNQAVHGVLHTGYGGGSTNRVEVYATSFIDNKTTKWGGALYLGTDTVLNSVLLVNNSAGEAGQAIYVGAGQHEANFTTIYSPNTDQPLVAFNDATKHSMSFSNSVLEAATNACTAGMTSLGYNALLDSTTCSAFSAATGDVAATTAMQNWDAKQGIMTATEGAQLLNTANKTACANYRVDALGNLRADQTACDRGAIEFGAAKAAQGTIAFKAPEFTMIEGAVPNGELVLQRQGGSDGTVTFTINDIDVENIGTQFYSFPNNQTITWEHGDTADKVIEVPVNGDSVREYNQQSITFEISNIKGGANILPGASTAKLVIEDDERQIGSLDWGRTYRPINVEESAGILSIEVKRKDGRDGEVSVDYQTIDGSALAGENYQAVQGTLTWKDLEYDSKFIEIPIIDNTYFEGGSSNFELELLNPTGGLTGDGVQEFAITDNEERPQNPGKISITTTSSEMRWFEGDPIKHVIVERSGGFDEQQLVSWRLDGSNLEDDFLVTGGTLVFSDQETQKTIKLQTHDDGIYEKDEGFGIQIFNVKGGATFATTTKSLVILNDDAKPQPGTFSIRSLLYGFNEASGVASVMIERTEGSDGIVTLSLKAAPETLPAAYAGTDFEAPVSQVIFADGETAKQIDIKLINDDLKEEDELFEVSITKVESSNALVSAQIDRSASSATVMIIDDETHGLPVATPTTVVTPTATPDVTPTVTAVVTPTITPTVTPTITTVVTPRVTPSATQAVTPVVTAKVTPTVTPTSVVTATVSPTTNPTTTPTAVTTATPAPQPNQQVAANNSGEEKSGSFGGLFGLLLVAGLMASRRKTH
ncbi:Calx-beta domain-containing protein [Salinibius halmophilus]|uniref:Calx-beta domain-containing protein n=1 Tax=Salinibius halmophilus TaxID=1853216 RepID=UPI000E669742|nr:Calx-beta domain-containing protein [Salinibius halmophilus]